MLFYLKFFIILFLLMISESVLGNHKGNSFKQRRRSTRDEIADITRTLTDEEIEIALSDLSLADLSALSRLIDNANEAEYIDTGDSLNELSDHSQQFEESKNGVSDNEDYDEMESQQMAPAFREAQGIENMKLTRDALAAYQNARMKREEANKDEGIKVDEEYLKLLENSFPHGAEHTEHGDALIKNDHKRVKRN